MDMIKVILGYYWQLIRLKETPENTPYSFFLVGAGGLFFSLILIVQWVYREIDVVPDLLGTSFMALCFTISYIIYTYAVLFFRGFSSRWVQTVTCLFFTHIIIHLLASPLLFISTYLVHANFKNPFFLFISVLYSILTLGLSIWQFVITAHIYKHALSTTAIQSVLAAFGLIATNILTVSFFR